MLGGKPATKAEAAEGSAEALARYNELKAKTPKTVAAQSKLAAWCEEHGLKAEAYVHYAEVVRLDPGARPRGGSSATRSTATGG